MGPVDWLAVVLATFVALVLAVICYGSLTRKAGTPRSAQILNLAANALLFFLPAVLLGHSFARIGKATLDAKPWLYPMISGGIVLAFIAPLLWFTYFRRRLPPGIALADSLFALATFLAMGAVFWVVS